MHIAPERINRNIDDLKANLRVFTRLASSLRNMKVRNLGQIAGVEHEIDLLRAAIAEFPWGGRIRQGLRGK